MRIGLDNGMRIGIIAVMQTLPLNELVAELQARKGDWQKVAVGAGLNYFTVVRIANGATKDPGVKTCAKLSSYLAANPVERV